MLPHVSKSKRVSHRVIRAIIVGLAGGTLAVLLLYLAILMVNEIESHYASTVTSHGSTGALVAPKKDYWDPRVFSLFWPWTFAAGAIGMLLPPSLRRR